MSFNQSNINFFSNIAIIAVADDDIDEQEKSLLSSLAKRLGLDGKTVFGILKNARNLKFSPPESEKDRLQQLEFAVEMMLANDQVHENEYLLCMQFAEMMNIPQEKIDFIMADYFEKSSDMISYVYNRTCQEVCDIAKKSADFVPILSESIKARNFTTNFFDKKRHNIVFYKLLWIFLVRQCNIHNHFSLLLHPKLDKINQGQEHWKGFFEEMVEIEYTFNSEQKMQDIHRMSLQELQQNIIDHHKNECKS